MEKNMDNEMKPGNMLGFVGPKYLISGEEWYYGISRVMQDFVHVQSFSLGYRVWGSGGRLLLSMLISELLQIWDSLGEEREVFGSGNSFQGPS